MGSEVVDEGWHFVDLGRCPVAMLWLEEEGGRQVIDGFHWADSDQLELSILQHVAVSIHEELEAQNALLENFELDVGETGARLSAANQRIRRVLADSSLCWPCSCACVAGFAVVVIIIILVIRVSKIAAIFSGFG